MHNQEQLINIKEQDEETKLSLYNEVVMTDIDQHQFVSEVNQVYFQTENLLDLVEGTFTTSTMLKNYQAFLLHRAVEIENPELIQQGMITSYKLYKIKSRKDNSKTYDTIVERRFSDFQFLHHQLIQNYGGCVIPKLPEKSIWASLNLQSQQFQETRMKQMQKYIDKLLKHQKIRYSKEVKQFLFEGDSSFSLNKGDFIQKSNTIQNIKNVSTGIYVLGKNLYNKFTKTSKKVEYNMNSQENIQLKLFEKQIDDLMRVSSQIRQVLLNSHQESEIIDEITILSKIKIFKRGKSSSEFVFQFKQLIDQFEDICCFIQSCHDAINRTKQLKQQIQLLLQQQQDMRGQEKLNLRNRQVDIIRSKIQKAKLKAERWTSSLLKQLDIYAKQGKTQLQSFVIEFANKKAELYDSC